MKAYETHSCGYRLTFPGPASIEDYDAKVGKPGTALEHACLHTIHTRTLPEWQEKFAALLQERTGIASHAQRNSRAGQGFQQADHRRVGQRQRQESPPSAVGPGNR